jgi:DNA-binding GntR family transcriptional regulator
MSDDLPESYAGASRPTAQSFVFMKLREEILNGVLPPGTRLRQADIGARLQVSTSPIREAFRQLATVGLVEIQPHRGAVVIEPQASDLSHMYQVRGLLEPICTAWAAEQISDSDIKYLDAAVEAEHDVSSVLEMTSLNRRFHGHIANVCGNSYLAQMVLNLLELSTPYIGTIFRTDLEKLVQRQAAEHHEIVQALRARDPEWAYKASLHHLAPLNIDGSRSTPDAPYTDVWLPSALRKYLRP